MRGSSLLRLAALALPCLGGGTAALADAPTAPIAAEALPPASLGAEMRPRWPGAADKLAFIGAARFDWAYRLTPAGGASLTRASVTGFAPVHLGLSDGQCATATPRQTDGATTALTITAEACPASLAPAAAVVPQVPGCGVHATPTPSGGVALADRAGKAVATLPMTLTAWGCLPGLHGGGDAVTLVGKVAGAPAIVSVTVPHATMTAN